jgi:hypothetical protein
MKFHPVGTELFHADRRTDIQTERQIFMTKLIFAFAILQTRLKRFKSIRPSNKVTLFSEVEERQGRKVRSFYVILQRTNTSSWIILHIIMLCCHIIDLVFVGNWCSAMINLDLAVSHITSNPSIYSTLSSVFQEATKPHFLCSGISNNNCLNVLRPTISKSSSV